MNLAHSPGTSKMPSFYLFFLLLKCGWLHVLTKKKISKFFKLPYNLHKSFMIRESYYSEIHNIT